MGWSKAAVSPSSSYSSTSSSPSKHGVNEKIEVLDENDLRELTRAVVTFLTSCIVGSIDKRNVAITLPSPANKKRQTNNFIQGASNSGEVIQGTTSNGGSGGTKPVLPVGQVLLGNPVCFFLFGAITALGLLALLYGNLWNRSCVSL